MAITFHNQHPNLALPKLLNLEKWILKTIELESFQLGRLSFIFYTDDALLEINKQFLNHNTYTDIITFNYNQDQLIIGEIYISLDRIHENAQSNSVSFYQEFCRILIHGILHLLGYHDKSKEEKLEMTSKEDLYLSLLPQIK
ncbi:MAG: rRNA maturation RNase YbeY [Bacteroidales bacterium]|nr:rRNA maturation RNase YbeY [Bacteroidales bacterium]